MSTSRPHDRKLATDRQKAAQAIEEGWPIRISLKVLTTAEANASSTEGDQLRRRRHRLLDHPHRVHAVAKQKRMAPGSDRLRSTNHSQFREVMAAPVGKDDGRHRRDCMDAMTNAGISASVVARLQ